MESLVAEKKKGPLKHEDLNSENDDICEETGGRKRQRVRTNTRCDGFDFSKVSPRFASLL